MQNEHYHNKIDKMNFQSISDEMYINAGMKLA